jgi:hypothetical protein
MSVFPCEWVREFARSRASARNGRASPSACHGAPRRPAHPPPVPSRCHSPRQAKPGHRFGPGRPAPVSSSGRQRPPGQAALGPARARGTMLLHGHDATPPNRTGQAPGRCREPGRRRPANPPSDSRPGRARWSARLSRTILRGAAAAVSLARERSGLALRRRQLEVNPLAELESPSRWEGVGRPGQRVGEAARARAGCQLLCAYELLHNPVDRLESRAVSGASRSEPDRDANRSRLAESSIGENATSPCPLRASQKDIAALLCERGAHF